MAAKSYKKKKRITRNDVAERAGVSPAVVSYVINSSKFVSSEKVAAVKQAIRELQYTPNIYARGLKTNRSMQIAFVCDNLRNDWLEIAESRLYEKGYYISHCFSRDDESFIQNLITRQFEAIFMMSNIFSAEQLNALAAAGIPVVLFRTRNYGDLDPRVVTLAPDYRDGIVKSVNYLAMKGHQRIALIPPTRYRTSGLRDSGFRVRAYAETMEQNGLEVHEEWVCTETDTMEATLTCVLNMLTNTDRSLRPTAFITGNDYMAVRLIQHLKKLGISVPKDVAVMGVDNTYLSTIVTPSLTTVDFSKEEFGRKLADKMLKLIGGEIPQDEYIKMDLVVRDSA